MSTTSSNRACESCRASKVRCKPAPDGTLTAQEGRCQRCAAAGRACVYTAPRRTKRKRTDVRVRELERDLKALGEMFRANKDRDAHDNQTPGLPTPEVSFHRTTALQPEPQHLSSDTSPGDSEGRYHHQSTDPIDHGLLSMDYAARLFGRYISDLAPQRPLVVFPQGTSAGEVRSGSPTLFLAILVAASSTMDTGLCTRLNGLLLQAFAERIMIRGESSVEIIQAILVSTNWDCNGSKSNRMKFYQQLHIAATMAVGIDLGESETWDEGGGVDDVAMQRSAIDRRRTLLGCYICCSSISLNFRRPNMLPFTTQMEDCIKALENSSFAAPGDVVIVAWTRLHHIVDVSDAALRLRVDSTKVDLSDPGVQLSLLNCTKQLEDWKNRTPATATNEPLLMQYHTLICLLHQVGLYPEYSPADFRPPYTITVPPTRGKKAPDQTFTPAHLSSVMKCISSAQAVIETFLSMPASTVVYSPVMVYARVGYVVALLTMIHASAVTPGGALNGVVDPATIKIDGYLNRIVRLLVEACEDYPCVMASSVWLPITSRLREWVRRFLMPDVGQNDATITAELVQPLKLLSLIDEDGPHSFAKSEVPPRGQKGSAITLDSLASSELLPTASNAPEMWEESLTADSHIPQLGSWPDDTDYGLFPGAVSYNWDGWVNTHMGSLEPKPDHESPGPDS